MSAYENEDHAFIPLEIKGTLSPNPPSGWTAVFQYFGPPPNEHSSDLGTWIVLLWTLRNQPSKFFREDWMICRDENGNRVIVVSQRALPTVSAVMFEMSMSLQDSGFVLENYECEATSRGVAQFWRRLAVSDRIALVLSAGDSLGGPDISCAFDDDLMVRESAGYEHCYIYEAIQQTDARHIIETSHALAFETA